MKIVKLQVSDLALLNDFIDQCGTSLNTFRYFNHRPLKTIQNHIITVLLLDATGNPIAYGHLEQEHEKVWLGICVAENNIGRGYGKRMMEELIIQAKLMKLEFVFLTVDKSNFAAIKLYEKFGFNPIHENEIKVWYQWRLGISNNEI